MPRHLYVWGTGDDSVETFTQEPFVVIRFNRSDLSVFSKEDLSKKPGIYILLGDENRCYIGQASGAVINRLSIHSREKNWWHSAVIFVRQDGALDRGQLDYLESKLIAMFRNSGFNVENGNGGNTSFIHAQLQASADNLLESCLQLLKDVGGQDVLKKSPPSRTTVSRKTVESLPEVVVNDSNSLSEAVGSVVDSGELMTLTSPNKYNPLAIRDNRGRNVVRKSAKAAFLSYLIDVIAEEPVISSWAIGQATDSNIQRWRFTESLLSDKEKIWFRPVSESLSFYANLSRKDIIKTLTKFSEQFDLGIILEDSESCEKEEENL